MAGRSAIARFFTENPILGGLFLIVVSVVAFFSISSSGQSYQPFIDGPAVTGRVVEVGQGSGEKKHLVKYEWRDPSGGWHRGESQSDKTWVGELERGDAIELKLSADDSGDAVLSRALDEQGLVTFLGKPAPSIIYISPILFVAGLLMLVFHRHIGKSVG